MRVELVTIGTELLLGFTVDGNAAHLGRALAGIGVEVVRRATVGDAPAAIRAAVAEGLARTGAVLTTGGLGPTADDVTKREVAALYDWPLRFDAAIWAELVARFGRYGRVPNDATRSQAEVPLGAVVLPNPRGTAPGLWLEGAPGLVVMLPGVPSEMRGLLADEVLPRLAPRAGGAVTRSRVLRTTGIPESQLATRLAGAEAAVAPLTLAYLPGVQGVDLRLTAWRMAADAAEARLAEGLAWLGERAAPYAYGEGDAPLAARVLERLRAAGRTLAVAESCTGGLLGGELTRVPGASNVFRGGVMAYANEAKVGLLGVAPATLDAHGAVSEPVARAMAEGVAARLGADVGVGVTGIAGPGGGTPDKPVGTVWLAVADGGRTEATRVALPGDRDDVRARAVQAALDLVRRRLEAPR